MSFGPEENPLNGVKVQMQNVNTDKMMYVLVHGTTEGYQQKKKYETVQERNKGFNALSV